MKTKKKRALHKNEIINKAYSYGKKITDYAKKLEEDRKVRQKKRMKRELITGAVAGSAIIGSTALVKDMHKFHKKKHKIMSPLNDKIKILKPEVDKLDPKTLPNPKYDLLKPNETVKQFNRAMLQQGRIKDIKYPDYKAAQIKRKIRKLTHKKKK